MQRRNFSGSQERVDSVEDGVIQSKSTRHSDFMSATDSEVKSAIASDA
jgi:hypothetical protein